MIKSVLEYIFCKTKKEEFAVQPYYVEVNLFTIPGISSYHTTLQIKETSDNCILIKQYTWLDIMNLIICRTVGDIWLFILNVKCTCQGILGTLQSILHFCLAVVFILVENVLLTLKPERLELLSLNSASIIFEYGRNLSGAILALFCGLIRNTVQLYWHFTTSQGYWGSILSQIPRPGSQVK